MSISSNYDVLSTRQRTAWQLRHVHRLSNADAARRMGLRNESSFSRLVTRAEKRLGKLTRFFGDFGHADIVADVVRQSSSQLVVA